MSMRKSSACRSELKDEITISSLNRKEREILSFQKQNTS